MSLAGASTGEQSAQNMKEAIAAFAHKQPTSLLHHQEGRCCALATKWLFAMDRALTPNDAVAAPPFWLRESFQWGPCTWPLHWCQAIEMESLDCGTLSALARESLKARGIPALPAQVIQTYTWRDVSHWKSRWSAAHCPTDWIHDTYVYHETVAMINKGKLRIWDPTRHYWLDPALKPGYGRVVAVRIVATESVYPGAVGWGGYSLPFNSWYTI